MVMKKMPPIEKIHEAYSAIVDGRVNLQDGIAKVLSSDRKKEYTVTWEENVYSSNDNATYWQGYAGYPIIAVLLLTGKLPFNQVVAENIEDAYDKISTLVEAFKINSTITSLNIEEDSIDDEGVIVLAEALKTNFTITKVNLSRNIIGDKGATALAEALLTNSTFTELDLSGNRIGDKGACVLAEALKINSTVTRLNIDNNDISNEITIDNVMHELHINRNKDVIFPKMKAFVVHKYCCVFLLPQIVTKKKSDPELSVKTLQKSQLFLGGDIVKYISEFLSWDDIYVRQRPLKFLAAQLNFPHL